MPANLHQQLAPITWERINVATICIAAIAP